MKRKIKIIICLVLSIFMSFGTVTYNAYSADFLMIYTYITDEMKDKLYGTWEADYELNFDSKVGHSLATEISGAILDDAYISISDEKYEEKLSKTYILSEFPKSEVIRKIAAREMYSLIGMKLIEYEKIVQKDIFRDVYDEITLEYIDLYERPKYMYYTETLDELATDENFYFSGIEGVSGDTEATIIIVFAYENPRQDLKRMSMATKFILVDDYVIGVRQDSFYELRKIDSIVCF